MNIFKLLYIFIKIWNCWNFKDEKQIMISCLGNAKFVNETGAVSCLSFSFLDHRILAGTAKGDLTLFDLKTGKLLQQCHIIKWLEFIMYIVTWTFYCYKKYLRSVGNGILSCQFTSNDSQCSAIVNDSGGSVYLIDFGQSENTKLVPTYLSINNQITD